MSKKKIGPGDELVVGAGLLESKMSVVGPVAVEDVLNPHVGFLDWDDLHQRYDIVCYETGRVMGTMDCRVPRGSFLIKYETEDGPWYVHSHMADTEAVPNLVSYAADAVPYNVATAQVICIEIMKGRGLSEVCKLKGMPSLVRVTAWRERHPEFNEMIEIAYKVRGELTRDRVAEIADDLESLVGSELELKAWSKKVDIYKWLAAQDNSRYSPKSEVSHKGGVGTIIIETGIRKEGGEIKEDYSKPIDVTPERDE